MTSGFGIVTGAVKVRPWALHNSFNSGLIVLIGGSSSVGRLERQLIVKSREESHSVQPHWEEGQRSRDSHLSLGSRHEVQG